MLITGLWGARRRLRCAPGDVSPDEAAALGLGAGDRVDELIRRYRGGNLWRAALWSVRRHVAWYALVGVAVVAVAPAVPWALRHTVAALDADGTGRGPGGPDDPGGLLAPYLPGAGSVVGWAALLSGVVLVDALARWLSTCHARRLVGLVDVTVQRAVLRRLQVVDEAWLRARGGSTSSWVVTYPQQLSQLAFVVEFAVNACVIGALAAYLLVAFGPAALWMLAAVAVAVVVLHRLVVATNRVEYAHLDADHERAALVETVAAEWQSIRRQHLEPQVLRAFEPVRLRQRALLRRRVPVATAAAAVQDALVPLVSVVGVGAVLLAATDVPAADAFALLAAARVLVLAVRQNVDTYDALRDAAETTPAVEALLTAPTLVPPVDASLPRGTVVIGGARVEPGTRVRLAGPGAVDVLRALASRAPADARSPSAAVGGADAWTPAEVDDGGGERTPSEAVDRADSRTPADVLDGADAWTRSGGFGVAVGGTAVLVGRGTPSLDGPIAEVATLWRRPVDEARYRAALVATGLAADLAARPGGDAALLSGTADRLSEGQAARLSLVQGLLLDADVLLVEDVFAPLDPARAEAVAATVLARGSGPLTRGSGLSARGLGLPTRVFVSSRVEAARHADVVLTVDAHGVTAAPGPASAGDAMPADAPGPRVVDVDEATSGADGPAPGGAGVDAEGQLDGARRFGFGGAAPVVADEAFEPPPAGRPTWRDFARNGAAVFAPRHAVGIAIAVVAFVAADLAIAASVARGAPVAALAGLAGVALLAAALRHALTLRGPIRRVDALHGALVRSLLRGAAAADRATVPGRLARDFFVLEAQTPRRYVWLLAGLAQSLAAIGVVVAGTPLAAALLVPVVAAGWLAYRASRDVVVLGSALAAAVRAPVLTFAAAAVACEPWRRSQPTRAALSARFDRLAELRASALVRYDLASFRARLDVELVGLAVFGVALWGVVVRPGPLPVAAGLVVFVAYTFAAELTSLVERLLDVDSLAALFARLAGLLTPGSRVLPRRVDRPADPWDEPAGVAVPSVAAGVVATGLVLTVDGRAGESGEVATPHVVARGVGLTVPPGHVVAITGPSGAGKSTLLDALSGCRAPAAGTVVVAGRTPDVGDARTRAAVALVRSDVPRLRLPVRDVVDPARRHGDDAVARRLATVFTAAGARPPGLDALLTDEPHDRRQLVNLTRALLRGPAVLLLDEATSALDPAAERGVLRHVRATGATTVLVLHRADNHDLADAVLDVTRLDGRDGA